MVLRLGQKVPEFSLPDADKKVRSLSEFTQRGKTILAFFPFAFSGTCDKEMCTFRDGFDGFRQAGAQLVGISVDSVYTLRAFAQTYNLQFSLLSDFNKKVSRAYGVLEDSWESFGYRGVSRRSVFVIDSRGSLRYRWMADMPSQEPPYPEVVASARSTV